MKIVLDPLGSDAGTQGPNVCKKKKIYASKEAWTEREFGGQWCNDAKLPNIVKDFFRIWSVTNVDFWLSISKLCNRIRSNHIHSWGPNSQFDYIWR